jgi:hypothetical protein
MTSISSNRIAGLSRFMHKEFAAVWPAFLFFLVGFLLLNLLLKVVLEEFSIPIAALSNAVVGAAIAAKAALALDETPLARALETYPRIVAVAVKTFLYGIATLLMGYLERFVEALRKVHGFDGAFQYVNHHSTHYRLLGWALGISIVFALYFSAFEISLEMGEGALIRFFFESRQSVSLRSVQ